MHAPPTISKTASKNLQEPLNKLVRLAGKIKKGFLQGEKVRFPLPLRCPFCHAPGHLCLIRWGYYSVKARSKCFIDFSPDTDFFWIGRFYCKNSNRTFSRLPDIFHPRKCYSQDIVSAVFDSLLESGKGLCETAEEFFISYQTILWWLS